jgi:hypothetical protein
MYMSVHNQFCLLMGAALSFFRSSDHRFAGYRRSLEKIDKDLQSAQARICGLKNRKQMVKSVVLALIIATSAVCAVYIAQLKSKSTLRHWDHFKHVAAAIAMPMSLIAARELVGVTIDLISRFSVKHVSRLEKQRNTLLKQLKDSTYYDEIFNIIETYDPEAQSRRAQTTQFSPEKGDGAPLLGQQPRSGAAHSPAVIQQGGQAMYHLFRTTGQALSPVMERLAGMMEDDPMQAAAFRQLLREQEGLRQEIQRLRDQLLAAGMNPDPVVGGMQTVPDPSHTADTPERPPSQQDDINHEEAPLDAS